MDFIVLRNLLSATAATAFRCALTAAVPPAHAMLTCKQWRIGTVFTAVQTNGAAVRFSLK